MKFDLAQARDFLTPANWELTEPPQPVSPNALHALLTAACDRVEELESHLHWVGWSSDGVKEVDDEPEPAIENLSAVEVIREVTRALANSDGIVTAEIASKILDIEITYEGDSMFSRKSSESKLPNYFTN